MLIELPVSGIVALNITGWLVIQLGLAWAFTRMPVTWFNPPGARPWPAGRWLYERVLAIRRWKDLLPDGARWFAGGFAKGTLTSADPDDLHRFSRETWRGELCHWGAMAWTPLFFLWNPWWADLLIVGYALAANLPCILVQRYTRRRLARLLGRLSGGARSPVPGAS